MHDTLYDEFYDPSDDFLEEPRAFCYELSSQLIAKAKEKKEGSWYEDDLTIKGILLLLYTWNFASPITKKLDFKKIKQLISRSEEVLFFLENYNIDNADENAWHNIKVVFDKFSLVLGQTGASKALSLLNSDLFVMWDTQIRKRLNRDLIKGIGNGKTGDSYVTFLKGIQRIIKDYDIKSKLPPNAIVAKKIDEYNYVWIVMAKDLKKKSLKSNKAVKPSKPHERIVLPNNLRGRNIFDKVIPTVCNLKNMLEKLCEVDGDIFLLKPWEKRSYEAYHIDEIKSRILTSKKENWKEIIKDHILRMNPLRLGASCIDIFLVAYVGETYGYGKSRFQQFINEEGISKAKNTAQAIWQVGKGDGVYLDLLDIDGKIKDFKFFETWVKGLGS